MGHLDSQTLIIILTPILSKYYAMLTKTILVQ